jgi:phage terminase Nu1 subunit (DNA packaging protein)
MVVDLDAVPTQALAAEVLGISQQAVSQQQADGRLPVGALREIVRAYCARLREQAAGRYTEGPLDLAQERAKLAAVQREGIEIKNAVLRGQYASIEMLSQVLATASQAVAERFDHLPGHLKKTCPHLSEADRDQVVAIVTQARNEWVRATAELVTQAVQDAEDDLEPELPGMDDEPRAD